MSILGGFYIYRVNPNQPSIKEASDKNPQKAEITGVVLFKNIGSKDEPNIVFSYSEIPTSILSSDPNIKKSLSDLAAFNRIHEFINTKNYDKFDDEKRIYSYDKTNPINLQDFIKKCYTIYPS